MRISDWSSDVCSSDLPVTVHRIPFIQKTAYDPKTDFSYIVQLTGYAFAVAVKADAPWKRWEDLIASATANPGKLSYFASGRGGSIHIGLEQIDKTHGNQ